MTSVLGNPDPDWSGLHLGWRSRGYLPHFDMPGQFQFITFRLYDSLPADALQRISAAAKAGSDEYHDEMDAVLDLRHGSCWLRQPAIASLVQDALLYFDAQRYNLLYWVIMPNHVHTLIRVEPGYPLAKTVHSWKSFTASKANSMLGRKGKFWEEDYFDRSMRSERHLWATARYIEENPVKAGLAATPEDWVYGSAFARKEQFGCVSKRP